MSSQYASVADWALAHAVSDVVLGAARRWDTGDELAPRTSSRSSWDRRMLDQRAEPCRSCEPDGPQYRLGRRLSHRLRYEGAFRESRAADGLYGASKLRSKFFERGHPLRTLPGYQSRKPPPMNVLPGQEERHFVCLVARMRYLNFICSATRSDPSNALNGFKPNCL